MPDQTATASDVLIARLSDLIDLLSVRQHRSLPSIAGDFQLAEVLVVVGANPVQVLPAAANRHIITFVMNNPNAANWIYLSTTPNPVALATLALSPQTPTQILTSALHQGLTQCAWYGYTDFGGGAVMIGQSFYRPSNT